jgi:thiol-disulfide isomerase/thioredoxin
MAMRRIGTRALACLMLWGGLGSLASAAGPTVAQLLAYKPKQEGVAYATPAEAEHAACKVEGVKLANRGSAWVLRDARGQLVRKFADTNGDNQVDAWSYFQSGQEVYREIDSNFNQKPDQYRWLGANGSRWGVDANEDGKVDTWKQISAEELSQEVLQAVATRDFARLQALMITKAELDALELPEKEAGAVRESVAQAGPKFQKTTAALIGLDAKTRWIHLETQAPQCVAGDSIGAGQDLIHHKHASVVYQTGDKQPEFLQTGELILVGKAWRLIDAPTPGSRADEGAAEAGLNGTGHALNVTAELKPLLEDLKKVDEAAPKDPNDGAAVAKYNLARAGVLERIAAATKDASQREQWVRQIADSLSAAAQNTGPGDTTAFQKLVALRDAVVKAAPGSNLAAYVTFREMSADYTNQIAGAMKPGSDMQKVQEAWVARLKKFVEDYPAGDDAPDAVMQLGMVSEFVGKDTEAKNWYAHMGKHYAKSPLAAKAAGALRRLNSAGQPLELAGPVLGSNAQFDVAKLKGKTVVVYYWASWNGQCAGDFAKLKNLLGTYGPKGLEVVTVNLDNSPGEAASFLAKNALAATHLYQQPGGLDSPLATSYGVMVLPNLFLVNAEGNVASHTVQIANLEEELKKLVK